MGPILQIGYFLTIIRNRIARICFYPLIPNLFDLKLQLQFHFQTSFSNFIMGRGTHLSCRVGLVFKIMKIFNLFINRRKHTFIHAEFPYKISIIVRTIRLKVLFFQSIHVLFKISVLVACSSNPRSTTPIHVTLLKDFIFTR